MPRLVSVVVPARNAGQFVAEAVESVLEQSYADFECIVIDDGSNDGTARLAGAISDPRVRVVSQENRGVALARNRGIAEAAGELVALLDADDVWLPGKLAAQVAALERCANAGAVVCGYAIVDRDLRLRRALRPRPHQLDMRAWLLGEGNGFAISSTILVRRDVVDAVGGFDPAFSTGADLDFALRVAGHAPVVADEEIHALYRSHPGQMHRNLDVYERDTLKLIERHATDAETPRAIANLYTRLAGYRLAHRDWRRAQESLAVAWSNDCTRLLGLPALTAVERLRRRLETRQLQYP